MKKTLQLIIIGLFLIAGNAIANENFVAKVVILRGQANAKLTSGKEIQLLQNLDIPEGAVIQTAEKSFVKLIFLDKSQMNLGPNSQMVINAFPKKEAGIITLVKGQLRSQVTKDYMEMDDKSKSKLFIKTTSAAMGVRGTDFQVNFNPENNNTSLITFEGRVAMSHLDDLARDSGFDQSKLEKVVSSDKAVMVTAGQISAVNLNVSSRAMLPTTLAPIQVNALKNNETGIKESATEGKSEEKTFKAPIPPGTDGAMFASNAKEVDHEVKGFFNDKTGEYKLPAGSIIDLQTVNIIPPPQNAVFDPNTKTFAVPDNFGKVDKSTGGYVAPEGLKLNSDGRFEIIEKEKIDHKGNDDKKRNPASVDDGKSTALPPTGNIYAIRPDMQQFADKFAVINPEGGIKPILRELAEEKISTTETVNQNNSNLGSSSTSTRTKIIFGAD